jgi:uncharacterized membrane protein YeaQ/YmgE (transglycosylase-associated protein family)
MIVIILTWLVVGLIVGWSAGLVIKEGGFGLVGDIAAGVLGGFLGGWAAGVSLQIGPGVYGNNLASVVTAFVGAVFLLVLLRILESRLKASTP